MKSVQQKVYKSNPGFFSSFGWELKTCYTFIIVIYQIDLVKRYVYPEVSILT